MVPDFLIYGGRILLAAVFGVAALAKLADRSGSSTGVLIDFGVPRPIATVAAPLLPIAELALAAFLISGSLAWWGAALGAALLAAFTVAMIANLARGRAPACNCFGQLRSTPISWNDVLRNLALLFVALWVVALSPRVDGTNAISGLATSAGMTLSSTVIALMAAVIAAQTFFVWNVFRQNGRILVRLDELERALPGRAPQGLPIGAPAPPFNVTTQSGAVSITQLLRDRAVGGLLVFTDPNCQPCTELLPQLAIWQREHASHAVVLITSSDGQFQAQRHGLPHVAIQKEHELAEAYGVVGTPAAVLVGADGLIAAPVALGRDAIARLLPSPIVHVRAS
ncbi:MAG TPA: MauE/DoxX family redox-associated membrane protein [Vicinamibacterales bacterium]|nr:MauE/DoxX family redox-associated membrane protein [Vicinamibacterales bacterium]